MSSEYYRLRPLTHMTFLLLTTTLVLYPFYLVYVIGATYHDGEHCFVYYGQWGICACSHLVLWSTILAAQIALYPLCIERNDDNKEYRLVLLAFSLPVPYDHIKAVRPHWALPCYVIVETSLGSLTLNPWIGVQAFIRDYEDARAKAFGNNDGFQRSSTMTAAAVNAVRRASGQGLGPLLGESEERRRSQSDGPLERQPTRRDLTKRVRVPLVGFSKEERSLYGRLFAQATSRSEFAGDVARQFFEKTGLDDEDLRRIWDIADIEAEGFLDIEGFSVALRLVAHAQNGEDVSEALVNKMPPILPVFDSEPAAM
eukprot:TRINITY_DN4115_c0_g1_i1.p1 TRINITY_DN4115_c0_g1~~TRINITY_DN4115_c0_g1_i1.p1  ORF type:complete len:313 (+),score=53.97 TRINITY_DN4115_c0_g1_i1:108-1046(+)